MVWGEIANKGVPCTTDHGLRLWEVQLKQKLRLECYMESDPVVGSMSPALIFFRSLFCNLVRIEQKKRRRKVTCGLYKFVVRMVFLIWLEYSLPIAWICISSKCCWSVTIWTAIVDLTDHVSLVGHNKEDSLALADEYLICILWGWSWTEKKMGWSGLPIIYMFLVLIVRFESHIYLVLLKIEMEKQIFYNWV